MLSRSLVVTLTTVSLLSGLILEVPRFLSSAEFSSAAYAQAVNNTEVTNYAQAVLEIEQVRQPAFNEIKRLISPQQMPEIVCNKPESFNSLPANARGIAQDFCKRSNDIVERRVGTARFNAITLNQQQDANLRRRIQKELLRLQNSAAQ